MLKQELFIWSINVAYRSGTTASPKMQDDFSLQQAYVFTIFETGNLLYKGLRCSTIANDRLCLPKNQVSLTSAILLCFPTLEPYVTNWASVCPLGRLVFSIAIFNFLRQCLCKSNFPWCSIETDLQHSIHKANYFYCSLGSCFQIYTGLQDPRNPL